ncbi:MAG: hypothetical protein HZC42_04850 [Candidatus Eisenbacteria bacterium]|nr:hypothetical protein [Candidatus Eisenbacteria bacterium]
MEGRDQEGRLTPPARGGSRARLAGAVLAGALLALLLGAAAGFLLRVAGAGDAAERYRAWLVAGGWLALPSWGGAAGALRAARDASAPGARLGALALALLLAALPLVVRPLVPEEPEGRLPRSREARVRAIRRWSYRSPALVGRIVTLSRDPDPWVREEAVLALGRNLVVSDIEHPVVSRPSRFLHHPLRDSLALRLAEALADPLPAIRAEAARALWLAPRTFGPQPAAAGTLAALLDRAAAADTTRIAWLALDAAAGRRDSTLAAAARRFGARATGPALRRAARSAAGGSTR